MACLDVGPALRGALEPELDRPTKTGQPIAAAGFGYGLPGHMFRVGVVSNPAKDLSPELTGLWLETDQPYVGGMSGGPVVNARGRVIGMVQRYNDAIGIGRSTYDLWRIGRDCWFGE